MAGPIVFTKFGTGQLSVFRTCRDLLAFASHLVFAPANNIPWKYYGNGFDASGTGGLLDSYCNICNPFEYEASYPSVVPDHMRDVTDLFTDLVNGTLPTVSYVKPDGNLDGHPASSKWILFEAFVKNIIELAQSNLEQWAETAIFVTVDEGGGFYDRASYSQSIFGGRDRAFR